jgi:hypothetical protein
LGTWEPFGNRQMPFPPRFATMVPGSHEKHILLYCREYIRKLYIKYTYTPHAYRDKKILGTWEPALQTPISPRFEGSQSIGNLMGTGGNQ